MTDKPTALTEWTLCTYHCMTVSDGRCPLCGGDRHLIQVVPRAALDAARAERDRAIAERDDAGHLLAAIRDELGYATTHGLSTVLSVKHVVAERDEAVRALERVAAQLRAENAKLRAVAEAARKRRHCLYINEKHDREQCIGCRIDDALAALDADAKTSRTEDRTSDDVQRGVRDTRGITCGATSTRQWTPLSCPHSRYRVARLSWLELSNNQDSRQHLWNPPRSW